MITLSKKNTFRWCSLIVIFLSVIFANTYSFITGSATIGEVTENYPAYIVPASYAFSIWGIIYISFIIFGIAMVMPFQKHFHVYDRLAVPLIFINILNCAWIVFYTHNFIGVSLLILILSLSVSFHAFRKAYLAVQYRDYNLWFQFPFSLVAGWLTVAVAVNLFVYLQYLGWSANLGEGTFTIVTIVILTLIAFVISLKTFSLVYPAAVGWGLIAIGVARKHDAPQIGLLSVTCGIALLLVSFVASVFRKIKSSNKIKEHLDI